MTGSQCPRTRSPDKEPRPISLHWTKEWSDPTTPQPQWWSERAPISQPADVVPLNSGVVGSDHPTVQWDNISWLRYGGTFRPPLGLWGGRIRPLRFVVALMWPWLSFPPAKVVGGRIRPHMNRTHAWSRKNKERAKIWGDLHPSRHCTSQGCTTQPFRACGLRASWSYHCCSTFILVFSRFQTTTEVSAWSDPTTPLSNGVKLAGAPCQGFWFLGTGIRSFISVHFALRASVQHP
mmetsp:Transcript_121971/g.211738  ORF Transcript_121971/g.211738 Transcript_121971/m.211738 type:complete len:235 (-) Transcript_121971:198-902(-)